MFGLTSSGFRIKTREEIFSELSEAAKEKFGADVDLTPHSPLGILFGIASDSQSKLWQLYENLYYASYVDSAEGLDLDRICRFGNVTRKVAQKETVVLRFMGADYTVIPVGFQVQTPSGIIYETIESKLIGAISTGYVDVNANAIETGLTPRVTANQLTEIITPISGLDSVTNQDNSSGGSLIESDAELRERFMSVQTSTKTSGAVDYIKQKILAESYIVSVAIAENPLPVEYNGLPANSLQFVVAGGTNEQVANLIYTLKPACVQTVGDITINVNTGFEDAIAIQFSRPTYVDIYAVISITAGAEWTADNIQAVKSAVVKYIGGTDTIANIDTEYQGLSVGEDVISWVQYGYFRDILGIEDLTVLFGLSALVVDQTKIVISSSQYARIITAHIVVNVI